MAMKLEGSLRWRSSIKYVQWMLHATLGNIFGGEVVVSVLNYGRVRGGDFSTAAGAEISNDSVFDIIH
jgi:formate/nitrite transporter FocA (FNT family)